MKNLLFCLIAVVALGSCKKESNVWVDENFSKLIERGATKILEEDYDDKVYDLGHLTLNFNQVGFNKGEVKYTYNVDSLTFLFEGETIILSYILSDVDVKVLCSNQGLDRNGDLDISVHGTWFFEDINGVRYTDGEPEKFGSEYETHTIRYLNKLPFKLSPEFLENETDSYYSFSTQVNSEVTLNEELIKYSNVYKSVLQGSVFSGSDSIPLAFEKGEPGFIDFTLSENLKMNQTYVCQIAVKWWVKGMEGEWLYCEGYDEVIEKKIQMKAIEAIEQGDFEYMYPLYRQCNYLMGEYEKGYFKMVSKQFNNYWDQFELSVVLSSLDSVESFKGEIIFNEQEEIYEYEIPDDFLENNRMYLISLVDNKTNKTLFSYHFRTSIYNTFKEKWATEGLLGDSTSYWIDFVESRLYSNNVNVFPINEALDVYETKEGFTNGKPLIQFESSIPNSWLNAKEYLMYTLDGLVKNDREERNNYSKIPIDAIYFLSSSLGRLTDNMIKVGEYDSNLTSGRLEWRVLVTMYYDWVSNFEQIDEEFANAPSIFEGLDFEQLVIPPMDISYVLPGINVTTSKIENFSIGDKVDY